MWQPEINELVVICVHPHLESLHLHGNGKFTNLNNFDVNALDWELTMIECIDVELYNFPRHESRLVQIKNKPDRRVRTTPHSAQTSE
jgi:hypothetical protein